MCVIAVLHVLLYGYGYNVESGNVHSLFHNACSSISVGVGFGIRRWNKVIVVNDESKVIVNVGSLGDNVNDCDSKIDDNDPSRPDGETVASESLAGI